MTDLLAARTQMAISLGFHIIFAIVGMGMPLLMVIAEGIYLRTKAGSKPKTISFASSPAEGKKWIDAYNKQLELNWEPFARATFQTHCANCHAVDTKAVGPPLKGLFGKTQTVIYADGTKKEITVDHDYLHNALRNPMSVYPEGYLPAMPPLPISDKEVDILIRWIKSM